MGATPLTLRCPKCKVGREYRMEREGYDNLSHKHLVPTGKSKTVSRTAAGVYGVLSVQMRHEGSSTSTGGYCGHVFWTTHPDAVRKVFPDAVPAGNATVNNLRAKGS